MKLIDFIKIIRANILLLFFVPLLFGTLVLFFTGNMPKTYVTRAKIYTGIASGYSIESQQQSSFNYFAINNAFDNLIDLIKSRSTIEETALKLYTLHLMQEDPNLPTMTANSQSEIKRITPPEIYDLVVKGSFEKTYQNLLDYKNRDETNFVYEMINLTHIHYSYQAVSKIRAKRVANSDMIEISYESDDPGVCFQTVRILIENFIRNNSKLKENQTDAVVNYFDSQLNMAHGKLASAEQKLLDFNMNNKIINYYEQTKHIASEKESFETQRQNVLLDFAAAESVISNLENNMGKQNNIQLHGRSIVDIREKLNSLNQQITLYSLKSELLDSNDVNIQELKLNARLLKAKLSQTIDSLHFYENTKEGLQVKEVVNNWLLNVIAFEEAKAKLATLQIRKEELDKTIAHYAPLGANLKKIEREIDVFEREYLSLLNSLNLAKLKQQNLELTSNIKVVDPPLFPINPLPSKRKFMILAAGFTSFFMLLGFIILIRFFDTTLLTNVRTEKATGLKGIGNFPKYRNGKKPKDDFTTLIDQSAKAIINSMLNHAKNSRKKPYTIGFVSNYPGEGKTAILEHITGKLMDEGMDTRMISKDTNMVTEFDMFGNQFSVTEIPSLINRILPLQLQSRFDMICYVIRADRGWNKADKNMLDTIKKVTNAEIVFILNAVRTEFIGDFTGQIPKKRGKIRKLAKRFFMFRFYETFEVQ